MKKIMLWILLVILILTLGVITYLKFGYKEDKLPSMLETTKFEYLFPDPVDNLYDEDSKITFAFNEDMVNICYEFDNFCEEVGYTLNEDKIIINKGEKIDIDGEYAITYEEDGVIIFSRDLVDDVKEVIYLEEVRKEN